ncbi:MAG: hypothetical protein IPP31_01295 [Chitinophagaceae bacterium]|nr:hypothetical protein [Chitinophagaceae bacterium]
MRKNALPAKAIAAYTLKVLFSGLGIPFFLCNSLSAQRQAECNKIDPSQGFVLRSATINGRWVSDEVKKSVDQIVGVGKPYDPSGVDASLAYLRKIVVEGEEKYTVSLTGSTSVLLVTADICDVSDEAHPLQAKVSFHLYYLRLDLYNLGDNILPIPRSPKPSFYKSVPSFLLNTAPSFGFTNDRRYGPALNVSTTTDFLNLSKSGKKNRRSSLLFSLMARKSITEPFYSVGTALNLNHPVYNRSGPGWKAGVNFTGESVPVSNAVQRTVRTGIFAGMLGNLNSPLFRKYAFGASANLLNIRFDSSLNSRLVNREIHYDAYALADGRLGNGFARMGIWFNSAGQQGKVQVRPYQRLAWQTGYAVSLGSSHSTIDLETKIGLGYAWGAVPLYNQFFPGNGSSQFLFNSLNSLQMQQFPEGVIIRSLGERSGTLPTGSGTNRGGNAYWNLNLNLAFPVSKWSVPLIPDIIMDEESGSTIRKKIKGQVNFAQSLIQMDLVDRVGLSEEKADEEATRIVNKEIRPAINYIADRANVYSFKPLLFFDLAQVSAPNAGSRFWGAAGAGIQLNIVNARLDIGYIHTLFPATERRTGNIILRFTVQDVF